MPVKKHAVQTAAEMAAGDKEVLKCIAAFKAGKPIMVFDSAFRERETDLLWPATAATPKVMRTLRNDCGGLLFLAIGNEVGKMFDLPWLQDVCTTPAALEEFPVLDVLKTNDLQYDTRSAFTLSLNHRDTYTGITDKDRALTTLRFGELSGELLAKKRKPSKAQAFKALGAEFRTPGHIPLCRESEFGLDSRQGHTELAVSIARLAGLPPCTIGAEMLQPNGDGALKVEDAFKYAKKHGIPMVTGEDLLRAHKANKKTAAKKTPTKKAAAKKTPTKKAASAKKKTPVKKAASAKKKTPTKKKPAVKKAKK